jgi:hypothetical protein
MGADISPEQLRALRLRAQRLYPRSSGESLAGVVRSLCGVNAQLNTAMMLALRARIKGLSPSDVKGAIDANNSLTRSWAMRGTLHLLDVNDLGWMVSLIGPTMIDKNRRRCRELGLDEERLEKGLNVLREILIRPMPRGELTEMLIDRGVDIDGEGQAPYHLIVHAALKGLISLGPDRPDGEQTYTLVKNAERQKTLTRAQALARLICRYLRGYGPAGPKDLAQWSGLPMADVRRAWALVEGTEPLAEVRVDDRALWSLASQLEQLDKLTHDRPVVSLLPAFDTLILGYSDRELLVPGRYRRAVYHGGQTVPVILVNGLAAGVWRYTRNGKKLKVTISPFEPFDHAVEDLVDAEVDDIGRFFGLPVARDPPAR